MGFPYQVGMSEDLLKKVRVDKWLWAVRIFRTRSKAASACRAGHVLVDCRIAKPSQWVYEKSTVVVRNDDITRTFRPIGLLEKRLGAPAVRAFLEDLTSPEEYSRRQEYGRLSFLHREPGSGRPTKKDRRALQNIRSKEADVET